MALTNIFRALAHSALPAAVADGVRVRALANPNGLLRLAYESLAQNALRVTVVDAPPKAQDGPIDSVLTAIASGTTDYVYGSMKGYKFPGTQIIKGGAGTVVITLELAIQNDGTAPGSLDLWVDCTLALLGVANITASELVIIDTSLPVTNYRWKYVTAGGVPSDLTFRDWLIE